MTWSDDLLKWARVGQDNSMLVFYNQWGVYTGGGMPTVPRPRPVRGQRKHTRSQRRGELYRAQWMGVYGEATFFGLILCEPDGSPVDVGKMK